TRGFLQPAQTLESVGGVCVHRIAAKPEFERPRQLLASSDSSFRRRIPQRLAPKGSLYEGIIGGLALQNVQEFQIPLLKPWLLFHQFTVCLQQRARGECGSARRCIDVDQFGETRADMSRLPSRSRDPVIGERRMRNGPGRSFGHVACRTVVALCLSHLLGELAARIRVTRPAFASVPRNRL